MKILLVEDNPVHIKHYEALIKKACPRCSLRVACDAIAVEAELKTKFKPDVAIVDIVLTGPKHGDAIIRDIRAAARLKNCMIFALTGHLYNQIETAARDAGCDAFFRKGRDDKALSRTLRRFSSAMACARCSGRSRPQKKKVSTMAQTVP